jgi:hypothetical protein
MEKIALLCVLMGTILAASSRTAKLATPRRNDANPLARRMIALDLDPYELRFSDHTLFRHLQRLCMRCESRECCLQRSRTPIQQGFGG